MSSVLSQILQVNTGKAGFAEDRTMPKIIVDKRELRNPVARELDALGCDLEFVILEVGDYVLSDRVGIERKTSDDFFNSLFGADRNKLFGQLHALAMSYERPLLLFEGYEQELFATRNVNPKAVQGILNSIALMRIPILYTLNPKGTAEIIAQIAAREQTEDKRSFSPHGKRSRLSAKEKKEYVISSFPDCGVGAKTATELLTHFGTIEKVVTASAEELQNVSGIGAGTATKIRKLLTEPYR